VRLGEPVGGVRRERVVRIEIQEKLQAALRPGVVAGAQQLHRGVVLLLRRQVGRFGRRRKRPRVGPRQLLQRTLRHDAERPLVRGRHRRTGRRRRLARSFSARGKRLSRGGAGPLRPRPAATFERQQALIQVLHQLIDAPFERAVAELELLDAPGQLPQLLLDPRKAHLEPGKPPRILGLDQLHRAGGMELAAYALESRRETRDPRVGLAGGEPHETCACRDQMEGSGVHDSCPWP
jgi:hypothetical protein